MGLLFGLVCVFALFAPSCLGAPLLQVERGDVTLHQGEKLQDDVVLAAKYIERFYSFQTGPPGHRKRSHPSFSSKLKDMQSFFRLNQTGSLNTETLAVMKMPRCGVPDIQEYVYNRGNRWKKNKISYSIGKYTSDLPRNTVDSLIGAALDVWAKASPLRFFRSSSQQADIMVEFGSKYHGDNYPFDGPKGTLAHAFDPGEGIGGDVHFDEDELWTADSRGFNLYLVAAHEFGHALGLKHSQNPQSLMYPTYRNRQSQNMLSSEDIRNINALYGPSVTAPYYPRLSWNYPFNSWYTGFYYPRAVKDKCDPDLSFDSVTNVGPSIFFFKDRYLWIKKNKNDIKEGPIGSFIPKINSTIDAAYWLPNSNTFLFSGSSYWTVNGTRMTGWRKEITSFGFPASVDHIDAAVHIPNTGHTLFFTQDQYWRYNEILETMESNPHMISDDFPGIKTPISAAVYKHGFLHFFVGPEVYKYDVMVRKVIRIKKANSWLGC
ncbi:collagenase 3 [Pangasianodon hypophthalmus]|uniref:collagenase 3 n=1 Tax=Pangasianodon hypophthalmus TaxID=310915 RepID=UPI002307B695|nr:collagenase 3 [Pangasianodon hypophthalmus]